MKSQSKKTLESAVATLNGILDRADPGAPALTHASAPGALSPLDVVNEVLKPMTEGYYIVAAAGPGGRIDGFAISRKPAEIPVTADGHGVPANPGAPASGGEPAGGE